MADNVGPVINNVYIKSDPSLTSASPNNLTWVDFTVIAVYFIAILVVGLYSSYRSKRASMKGYFLASRNMHWLPVGASLFASNIGSGHFIGLAGSGAASGIGIAAYELSGIFTLLLLGYIFVPVYMSSGVYTMPEYLRLRFGGQRIRVYLAVLALLLYVFTKISADLYAGALFIQLALGFKGDEGLYISIFVLLGIAALFTIAGGLTAVIWTDFIQTILMLFGASILMILSINAVGGYNELIVKYMSEAQPDADLDYVSRSKLRYDAFNRTCGSVPDYAMHLMRNAAPGKSDLPWTGLLFGLPFTTMWYFCSDQVIVQRALASKDMSHAKGGCILAGYLKLTPLFLLVFPGMASRVLYKDRVACTDPDICTAVCGSSTGCTNIAYAELVIRLMPIGLSGLMLAVMMAALLSSLTSIFNSSSTIFTIDIWTQLRKKSSDTELLLVGRFSVLVLLVISVLWVPILKELKASQLFVYIQQVQNFLAPPISVVFLMALFLPKTTETGAFWGLMVGLTFGILRFVLEFSFVAPPCGSENLDDRPEWIKEYIGNVHFLHYSCILAIITFTVSFIVSSFTPSISPAKLERLTFWTRHSTKVREPFETLPSEIEDVNETNSNCPSEVSSIHINTATEESNGRLLCSSICICCCCCRGESETTVKVDGRQKLSPQEEATAAAKFLDETSFWYRFVNVNAILLIFSTICLWIWFA